MFFSDFEDAGSLDGSIDNMERGSLASFGSGTTTDSENNPKVRHKRLYLFHLTKWKKVIFILNVKSNLTLTKWQMKNSLYSMNDFKHC